MFLISIFFLFTPQKGLRGNADQTCYFYTRGSAFSEDMEHIKHAKHGHRHNVHTDTTRRHISHIAPTLRRFPSPTFETEL